MSSSPEKLIATNRKALRDYSISEKFEAGIILSGTEVKSLRNKGGNLNDSFARVQNEELWLYNLNINPYAFGNRENHDPTQTRKLLVHKKEIKRLVGLQERKGFSIIALRLYFKGSLVKIELGLGKGKTAIDKREDIKKKEHNREMQKELKYRHHS